MPEAAGPIRVMSICLVLTGIFAVPGAQLVRNFRQDRILLGTSPDSFRPTWCSS